MMLLLPAMYNPYVLNSKEAGGRKALNIDQELIFKSVFNSSFNMNSKTRAKTSHYYIWVFVSLKLNIHQPQIQTEIVNIIVRNDYSKEKYFCHGKCIKKYSRDQPVAWW